MAHDVFISHSAKDKATADAVCAVLESQGVRCWVAPRDIIPGKDWGESIVDAIKGARVMVLIFSTNANNSQQIKREVERAVNKGIPVIPLRIEDVTPTASLEYFLSTPHWLDAFTPPLEKHLQYLAQIIRQIVSCPDKDVLPVPTPGSESPGKGGISEPAITEKTREGVGISKSEPPDHHAVAPTSTGTTSSVKWVRALAGMVLVLLALLIMALNGWFSPKPLPPNGAKTQAQTNAPQTSSSHPVEEVARSNQLAAIKAAQERTVAELQAATQRAAQARAMAEQQAAASRAAHGEAARPTILVVPDQYTNIQSAIDAAKPGDTIKIRTGVYDESIHLAEGIKLIGEGKDMVTIRSAPTTNVLYCSGVKTGYVSGLTFEHTGKTGNTNNVFPVAWLGNGCSIEITGCQFTMGDGAGIHIMNGSPKISGCILQENGGSGIQIHGSGSHPVVSYNQCHDNGFNGIVFSLGAGGEADKNTCENNKQTGILVSLQNTAPVLKANQCRANGSRGICFQSGAAGDAEGNLCENNAWDGITLLDAGTTPLIKINQCRNNQMHGIRFIKGAGGSAEGNTCENNKLDGILIAGSGTAPAIKANRCRMNGLHGISFEDAAAGDAEQNVCENNKQCGIAVFNANTQPQIDSNICRNNTRYGIYCTTDSNPQLGNNNQLTGNTSGTMVTKGVISK